MHFLLLAETLALVGGTVHSMKPGEAPRVATILIQNDRIAGIGPDLPIESGARRIDLSGLHVAPGLIDGMVHHDSDHDVLYVSAGVTLARDAGNDLARILSESDRNARERGPGPWLWVSGAVIDGSKPSTSAAIVVGSPADAEAKLPTLFEFEPTVDFVSTRPGLSSAAWKRVVELAHGARKQVWSSLPPDVTFADAGAAKLDGIFHLAAFLPAGKTWNDVGIEDLEPAIEAAAAAGIAVTPTLAVFGERLVPPQNAERELDYLGPFYDQSWRNELADRRLAMSAGADGAEASAREHLKRALAVVNVQGALVKALHAKGVAIVPGSASPNPWLFPGDALLDELLLLRRAGVPQAEVLQLATQGAAARLGIETRGTIEVHKIADLVVTADDPSASLEALKDPKFVVLRGQVFTRAELDEKKRVLKEKQSALKAALSKSLPVGEPDLPAGDVLLQGYVETLTLGARVSAERFVVVRRYDGALVYNGRIFAPGSVSVPDTETWVSQTIRDGDLDVFAVKLRVGTLETELVGERAGGRLNIVRRDAGAFVSSVSAKEKLAFVDAGSVTAALVLGYHQRKEGAFNVLFFEDLQPGVAPWQLRLDTDGVTHLVKTHQGALKVKFGPLGSPEELWREAGSGRTLTATLEVEAPDGRGLPTPKDKRAVPAASEATPAKKPGGG